MKKGMLGMLVAVVVVMVLVGLGFSQELALGCRPKETPKSIISDGIIWNRISVKFKVGVVNLVQKKGDTIGVPIENVEITSPRVRALCDSLGAVMITQIFKGSNPADTLSVSRTGEIVRVIDLSQWFSITFGDSIDVKGVAKLFKSLPEVRDASHLQVIIKPGDSKVEPNDEHFQNGDQWGLNGTYGINAPAAWDSSKGDGIIIGIIEEGVDRLHNDLLTKIYGGETGYWGDHGTKVAGVAAASTNNVIGIAGVAWNSLIMPMNHGPGGYPDWVAEDMRTAVNDGADILNCSFFNTESYPVIEDACQYAYEHNVVVVAGAGNDDFPIPYDAYPAAFDSFVIAVGAINEYGERRSSSNYGSWLDVMAPGENIWTTEPLDYYGSVSGTSFSTAFVSGIAALIRSAHPSFSADKVKWKICSSAIDMGEEGWDEFTGHGRVYAPAAVGIKEQETQTSTPLVFSLSQNYPNPFNATTAIDYALSEPGQVGLEIYNITGQKVATLIDQKEKVGYHTTHWDARTIPSGIYFYRLQAEDWVETKRMILLK